MTNASNRESHNPGAGRSGNDYLQGTGAGYQSWRAEGPSGSVASGGLDDVSLQSSEGMAAGGQTRGAPAPSLGTLLAGVGVGAALMFFLDPDRGARRRNVVRDQVMSTARSLRESLRDRSVDARNRARGRAVELRARLVEEDVPDEQLVARVRAELGHHVDRVRPIEVTADGGTVTLRGSALPDELPKIVAAAGSVRGVARVENQLDVRAE